MSTEATEVIMPLMGEGITEATLVKWLKKVGDSVKKDEPLLEVSTDKVDTEIPAPASGFLTRTFADGGATVAVNSVIAEIAASATGAGAAAPQRAANGGVAAPAMEASQGGGRGAPSPANGGQGDAARPAATAGGGKAPDAGGDGMADAGRPSRSSPLVRKMAKDHDVDLSRVTGTGLGGRITKRDLEAFSGGAGVPDAPSRGPARPAVPGHLETGRLETRRDGARELLDGVPVRREPMTKMRALIAEHMVRSVRTSAHVTTVFEIDMHRVTKYREKHKGAFQAAEGFGLNYTAFFVHAAIQSIKKHPVVNVSVDGNDILWKDTINLGVAVAIETGLIVPVIKNAGELNLLGIARRINDLATRARTKKLTPGDVQGGTFSITNPGMFGSIVSAPIINQPQVAILSIGAIVKRPVVIDDLIGIRPLVQVGLTFDHRVVDGEGGARFLATFKELLESFDEAGA